MSGQRPPTNTRASWEDSYSEGQHPTEDLLLAFVRHQHLDNEIQEEIEQHIKDCPFCRHQCRAFEQHGLLITSRIQEQKQQFYRSITDQVMRRAALENSLSSQDRLLARFRQAYKYSLLEGIVQKVRGQQRERGRGTDLPALPISPLSPLASEPLPPLFAALQDDLRTGNTLRSGLARSRRSRPFKWSTAAALIVVAAILTLAIGLFASPALHQGPANHVQSTPPSVLQQRNTPTPGTKVPSTPTKTPTVNTGPQIWLCSTPNQSRHDIVDICGSHFTPGGRVWLTAYGPNLIFARTANEQGAIDITFTLNDCRAMPALIMVVDGSSHREAMLSNLSLSGCQPSRHH